MVSVMPVEDYREVFILIPEDHLCRVFGKEKRPRPTYLELDPLKRVLSSCWEEESDGEVPEAVRRGEILRFRLPSPYLSAGDIEKMMEMVQSDCQTICEGYWQTFDGGSYTDEATEAVLRIEAKLRSFAGKGSFRFQDTVFHR